LESNESKYIEKFGALMKNGLVLIDIPVMEPE
jgi:hypothetical protein